MEIAFTVTETKIIKETAKPKHKDDVLFGEVWNEEAIDVKTCNNKLASVSFYIYNEYQYPADPAPGIYGYDLNQREI